MKKKVLVIILASILILALTLSISSCINFGSLVTTTTTTPNNPNNDIQNPEGEYREPIDYTDTFYLVHALFNNFSIFDIDYETAMLAAIRAYVDATGDKYAMFYTPEEYELIELENAGDLYGIGVQVIFDYDEHFMEVVLTMPDSPAEQCMQIGDKVTHIIIDGNKIALADIVQEYKEKAKIIYPYITEEEINIIACYETFQYAVSCLKGPEGTYAEFVIIRNGQSLDMKVQRTKVKTISVTAKTSIRDPQIGIVSISSFDLTTPTQFQECMDELILQGCNKFIFDLRNNPGGNMTSLKSVMCTLLQNNQVIYTTKDHNGDVVVHKVQEYEYQDTTYATCNVSENDIGKYSAYEYVVLANENTASAAELFTAVLRDYGLAQIVGLNTYGKGSVQSTVNLSSYGDTYHGMLKFTTKLHFPPCGEGYDGGIGIAPNHVVKLEGIAAETHFYKLTEEIDNQLQKAVSVLID